MIKLYEGQCAITDEITDNGYHKIYSVAKVDGEYILIDKGIAYRLSYFKDNNIEIIATGDGFDLTGLTTIITPQNEGDTAILRNGQEATIVRADGESFVLGGIDAFYNRFGQRWFGDISNRDWKDRDFEIVKVRLREDRGTREYYQRAFDELGQIFGTDPIIFITPATSPNNMRKLEVRNLHDIEKNIGWLSSTVAATTLQGKALTARIKLSPRMHGWEAVFNDGTTGVIEYSPDYTSVWSRADYVINGNRYNALGAQPKYDLDMGETEGLPYVVETRPL